MAAQEVVIRVVRIDGPRREGCEVRNSGQRLEHEAVRAGSEHGDPALDVVEHGQEEVVPRTAEPGERGAVGRLEQNLETSLAAEEGHEVDRQERSRRVAPIGHTILAPEPEEQPLAVQGDRGIVGFVELDELASAEEVDLVRVGGERAVHQIAFEPLGVVAPGDHRNVVRTRLVDDFGSGERRAPAPQLGDPRVPRPGQRARSEIGTHVERIVVDPPDVHLGLVELESILDERALLGIELADDRRVAAPA